MTLEQFLPLLIEGLRLNLVAKGNYGFRCGYADTSCRGCPLELTNNRWCRFDGAFKSSPEVNNYIQLNYPEVLL